MSSIRSPRQQSLVVYLLVHRDISPSRRMIAFHLWPESSEKQALTNLRRELFHLRRSLPEAERFIHIQHQTIAWRADSSFRLDVADFESEVLRAKEAQKAGQLARAREALRNALAIYKGPLVPHIYEEWIIPHREELQQKYVRVLEQLFEIAAKTNDYPAAAHYAERLLKQNPLQESWYRRLIRLHVAHGNRAEALRIYNLCAETLRYELDVEPGPQTQSVFQRLLAQKQTGLRTRNFPAPTTPFIGREAEIVALVKLLRDKDCRLLTLAGPGGVGKTRLAIQAALSAGTEYLNGFEDGLYFVSLVPVASSDLLIPAISESLGLAFQAGEDPRRQLLDYLAEKSLLLLLDSFEHLRQSRDLIVQIGRQAPNVKLLITSRERLNLNQERVYPVKGLGFSAGSPGGDFEDQSAMRLFYTSAGRIHIELAHLEDSYPAVARICRLLEGNPLAIELAASWAGALTPQEIAGEIETGLDFLTTSQLDLPPRHRSMRAVFEHSWQLLSAAEQTLLRSLTMFPGRFSRPAARQIAGGTLRGLSSLVDKSMLHWRPDGYYEMHRLLRQFAAEKLAAHPREKRQVAERFSRYYLHFLHAREAELRGKEAGNALRQIVSEFDNIRAAWNLAIETANIQALGRSAPPLRLFYDLRGWFQEGAAQFAAAAESLRPKIKKPGAGRDELDLLYWKLRLSQAAMNYRLGRYDQAQEILERCGRGLDELNRPEEKAQILLQLGQIAFRRGEHEAAQAYLEKSLDILRQTPNRWQTATALSFLGDVMRSFGEYDRARTYLYEALAMRKEIGNPARVADSLNMLGIVLSALGEYPRALETFQESLAIRRSLDDPWGAAKTLNNLAILMTWMGNYPQAREHHAESLALRREIGNPFGIAIALHNLGDLAYRLGDRLEAEARLHEALAIRRRINSKQGIASTLNILARLALEAGDETGARRFFREALQIAAEIQAVPTLLAILAGIAALLTKWGQDSPAANVLSTVVAHPGVENDTRESARAQLLHLGERVGEEPVGATEAPQDLGRLTEKLLAIL